MSLVTICCKCGRWHFPKGGICMGRPCQIEEHHEVCVHTDCNHKACKNCGVGKLNLPQKGKIKRKQDV